jgi:hypothetical protein
MRKLIVLVGLSRVRLGLLAAIASVGLAFPAAAQAAPPDPVTLGATTLSNIRLNGVPGTQLVVAPGANVTITADWVDNNTGCPGCIDNLPVAFQGFGAQPAGCIEQLSGLGGSGTGTVSLGAAPTTPGYVQHRRQLRRDVLLRTVLDCPKYVPGDCGGRGT